MNRILGSLKNVIVLSEVNPWGSFKPMLEQAQEWLSIINDEERRDLEDKTFVEQIRELQKRAENKGKRIIVRDWTVANFFSGIIQGKKPSRKLETLEALKSEYLLKPLVLMRDPYSTWVSNQENFSQYFKMDAQQFFSDYYQYLISIQDIPRLKLEDFTAFPKEYIEWICQYWKLSFDENCLNHYADFNRCTGDNTLAKEINKNNKIERIIARPWPKGMDHYMKKNLQRVYELTSYDLPKTGMI